MKPNEMKMNERENKLLNRTSQFLHTSLYILSGFSPNPYQMLGIMILTQPTSTYIPYSILIRRCDSLFMTEIDANGNTIYDIVR